MKTPSIHTNGTSAEALASGFETALRALEQAIACLQDAAPNGRDYYRQGTSAYAEAASEHEARVGKLTAVRGDLFVLYEHTQAAIDEREERKRTR